MADLSDVTQTLVTLAAQAIYPNGMTSPSVIGAPVKIFAGWPLPAQLNADVSGDPAVSQVSVFPLPGMDANVTRFLGNDPVPTQTPTASLTMTVSGTQVTVGGTVNPGEAAMIAVNRVPYSHKVAAGDTLASIASALAALIPNATASGAVVTVGGSVFQVDAAVSAVANLQAEIARQKRVFQLTAWAPTPDGRDMLIQVVDVALKAIPGRRILLPDNTYGILIYRGTLESDELSTRNIFRRDLRYEVEYATTQQATYNTITNTQTTITPAVGAAVTVYNP